MAVPVPGSDADVDADYPTVCHLVDSMYGEDYDVVFSSTEAMVEQYLLPRDVESHRMLLRELAELVDQKRSCALSILSSHGNIAGHDPILQGAEAAGRWAETVRAAAARCWVRWHGVTKDPSASG